MRGSRDTNNKLRPSKLVAFCRCYNDVDVRVRVKDRILLGTSLGRSFISAVAHLTHTLAMMR